MQTVTKEIALAAHHRQNFYFRSRRDGTVKECRVNGACQTWKTRPNEFKLPMKFGFRECFYIDHDNAAAFFLTRDIPADAPRP